MGDAAQLATQPVETRYSSTANTCLTTPAAAVRTNPQSRMKRSNAFRATLKKIPID